jgi:hypothetical protein
MPLSFKTLNGGRCEQEEWQNKLLVCNSPRVWTGFSMPYMLANQIKTTLHLMNTVVSSTFVNLVLAQLVTNKNTVSNR